MLYLVFWVSAAQILHSPSLHHFVLNLSFFFEIIIRFSSDEFFLTMYYTYCYAIASSCDLVITVAVSVFFEKKKTISNNFFPLPMMP